MAIRQDGIISLVANTSVMSVLIITTEGTHNPIEPVTFPLKNMCYVENIFDLGQNPYLGCLSGNKGSILSNLPPPMQPQCSLT